ncbi:MAG: hypothetical protein ACXAD7_07140 [Candidatus Kariarchaeaceae archaeon]|jgi:hypothetical protein
MAVSSKKLKLFTEKIPMQFPSLRRKKQISFDNLYSIDKSIEIALSNQHKKEFKAVDPLAYYNPRRIL